MWNANKHCILFLIIAAIILAAICYYIHTYDPALSGKIAYTGFCGILFVGGLISWYLARRG